ncbi:MAG: triose-phosphate isomerase [Thermoanaerobaculia bacterium]
MIVPLLAANWKMNMTEGEAVSWCQSFISLLPSRALQYVLIAPPFTLFKTVMDSVVSTPIMVSAQNCHWEEKGAFTGEISPTHLKDLKVCWTIIGHSERRHIFKEDQEMVNKRLKGALQNKLKVIYCIGEKLQEREKGDTLKVIKEQMAVLEELGDLKKNLVIAYEPVWAIGTGIVAKTEQIQEVHKEIKNLLNLKFFFDLTLPYRIFLFIFLFLIVFIFIEAIITPPLSWDSLYYHMYQSALFVQEGSFSQIPFDGIMGSFKYHPKNFEIFLSFFLLPFKSDFFSNLCNFFFLQIAFLGSLILLNEFAFSKNRILLFLINFFTIPAFFIYLPTQYIEISSLSLIISSFAFLKVYEKDKNFSFIFLSSLCLSLALSFKAYNFLPYALGHIFILYFLFKDKRLKFKFLIPLFLINILFSFHYIKMAYNFKNPIYPYPLKVFGKNIGMAEPSFLDYLKKMEEKQKEWFSKREAQLKPLEKKISPYLYTIFTMFSQNHQALGRPAFLYCLLGFLGLLFLRHKIWKIFFLSQILLFLFQFFTPEMEPLRLMFSLSYSRIFLLPVFILTFLSLCLFEKFKIYEVIFFLGFLTNIFLILPEKFLNFHLYVSLFALVFAIYFFLRFFRKPGITLLIFLSIFIILSPFIYKIKESQRLYLYLNYYHVSKISRSVFPVATFFNGKGVKIYCNFKEDYFSSNPLLVYPLIGTRFENRLLYISPENLSFEEWLFKLKEAGVEYILLKGTDKKEFSFISMEPEIFEFLFEREGIFIYKFKPR